jgi:hypothetical protein
MTSHVNLDTIHLDRGNHNTREQGVCVAEAAAWFAGEPHSDHPACISPVLGAFVRSWNDTLDDTTRQRLIPFIPRLVGTANDGGDQTRVWMLVDWLARVYAPAFLRDVGLAGQAGRLEQAPPIIGPDTAISLQPELDTAQTAAWAAAGAATGDAAWVAGDAGAAAGAAAGNAAWATTREAGAAARAAVDAAAWAAAGAAVDAARAAAGAAGDAARDVLSPTVERLQESAFGLLGRMCDTPHDPATQDTDGRAS